MRPRLELRLERLGGGQHAAGQAECLAAEAARVAGAVEPLADLAGEPARLGERVGAVQHPLGVVRVDPHPFPLRRAERAGLVPDRVRDAQPAEPGDQAGAVHQPLLLGWQPQLGGSRPGQPRHGVGVAQGGRRLEVDEAGDGGQGQVALHRGQGAGQPRLAVDHRIPGVQLVEVVEDLLRVGAHHVDESRVELGAGPAPGQVEGAVDPVGAVGHLEELRELGDPGGDRDPVSGEAVGDASSVPPLVGLGEGIEDVPGQAELLAQRPRQLGVPRDHAVELLAAREGEVEADADPVQGRSARPEQPQHGQPVGGAELLGSVLGRLESDVVAEPARLLVRVGVAAHVHQERRVVDRRPAALVEADQLGDPQRDPALAQDVLHRLAEAEVHAQGQGSHQLGELDAVALGLDGHLANVRLRDARRTSKMGHSPHATTEVRSLPCGDITHPRRSP